MVKPCQNGPIYKVNTPFLSPTSTFCLGMNEYFKFTNQIKDSFDLLRIRSDYFDVGYQWSTVFLIQQMENSIYLTSNMFK